MIHKIYVKVQVEYSAEGVMQPRAIIWEDGRKFEINKFTCDGMKASLQAGGNGIRYTCTINRHQKYLFYEDPKWFVEGVSL